MKMHAFLTAVIAVVLVILCGVNYASYRHGHKPLERRVYAQLAPPGALFSHAVKYGNLLYLSGMTAYGTTAQGKAMAEQASEIWKQIEIVAKAEGVELSSSLIKVTMFITDFSQAPELREVLSRQYNGQLPASSLIEVKGLFSPEISIEIEAVLGL